MIFQKFVINKTKNKLSLQYDNNNIDLSFEYLRISTPNGDNNKGKTVLPTHKKNVQLLAIEIVGKHGYRLRFDDEHSAIYTENYFTKLIAEYQLRWDKYLIELKESGHSREAMINITQL